MNRQEVLIDLIKCMNDHADHYANYATNMDSRGLTGSVGEFHRGAVTALQFAITRIRAIPDVQPD